jgi:hypothetical protein
VSNVEGIDLGFLGSLVLVGEMQGGEVHYGGDSHKKKH